MFRAPSRNCYSIVQRTVIQVLVPFAALLIFTEADDDLDYLQLATQGGHLIAYCLTHPLHYQLIIDDLITNSSMKNRSGCSRSAQPVKAQREFFWQQAGELARKCPLHRVKA